MISKKMEKAINEQINRELFSEYLYLSMQAWFAGENLDGMASWMAAQSQEERFHAMKFFDYLMDRGGTVKLMALEQPEVDFKTPLNAFTEAYKHEQFITQSIHDLLDLAIKEKDHPTQSFLQWFVDEQVEEEATADKIVQRLKMAGNSMSIIFMMDRELGEREFDPEDEE
ncbi:MAG: ferritin [Candidatus Cloacimonetes bacterium]|nr:ferritin [Candidatus Cloacimonadota bacterium]